jgi:hypothetical protein
MPTRSGLFFLEVVMVVFPVIFMWMSCSAGIGRQAGVRRAVHER